MSLGALQVLLRQGTLVGLGIAAALMLRAGLSPVVLILVGGMGVGAWWWAVQQPPERLERPRLREVSLHAGLVWGGVGGAVYAAVGSRPGQLDMSAVELVVVAMVLSGMGALAAMGLTLCGLDAGRTRPPG